MERPSSARVVARRPLLRAGLERLAGSAGLEVVDDADGADLVLCWVDDAVTPSAGDVIVSVGNIVVTCSGEPDPVVWEIVRRLIHGTFAG